MIAWLSAFAVTQAVEVPIYRWALKGRSHPLLIAFGASCLTHPLIFVVLPRYWAGDYLSYVFAAEGIAVGLEAIWLGAFGLKRSVWWALGANALSTAIGLGLRALIGWP